VAGGTDGCSIWIKQNFRRPSSGEEFFSASLHEMGMPAAMRKWKPAACWAICCSRIFLMKKSGGQSSAGEVVIAGVLEGIGADVLLEAEANKKACITLLCHAGLLFERDALLCALLDIQDAVALSIAAKHVPVHRYRCRLDVRHCPGRHVDDFNRLRGGYADVCGGGFAKFYNGECASHESSPAKTVIEAPISSRKDFLGRYGVVSLVTKYFL
jgi:hypothetical protein